MDAQSSMGEPLATARAVLRARYQQSTAAVLAAAYSVRRGPRPPTWIWWCCCLAPRRAGKPSRPGLAGRSLRFGPSGVGALRRWGDPPTAARRAARDRHWDAPHDGAGNRAAAAACATAAGQRAAAPGTPGGRAGSPAADRPGRRPARRPHRPGTLLVVDAITRQTAELALLVDHAWWGNGKWLARQLAAVDSRLADDLAAAAEATQQGKAPALISVAERVVERAGGPLRVGWTDPLEELHSDVE